MDKELANPENVKITRSNLSKDEKKVLKEIKSGDDKTVSVQGKRSTFIITENEVCKETDR